MSHDRPMHPHHNGFVGRVEEAPTARNGWLWTVRSEDGHVLRTQGDWSVGEIDVGRQVKYHRVRLEDGSTLDFLRSPPGAGELWLLSEERIYECRVLELPRLENADSLLLESIDGKRFRIPQAFMRGLPDRDSRGVLEVADPLSDSRPWTFTPEDLDVRTFPHVPGSVEGSFGIGRVWNGYRWVTLLEGVLCGLVDLEVFGELVEERWMGAEHGLRRVWLLEGLVVVTDSATQLASLEVHLSLESARHALDRESEELEREAFYRREGLGTSLHEWMTRGLAEAEAEMVVQRAIWRLRRMDPSESSPYQELGFLTRWDDISWQVQKSHGPCWEMDFWAIQEVVREILETLPDVSKQAMWLETREGSSWASDEAETLSGRDALKSMCWNDDEIWEWIAERILLRGENENNVRIARACQMGHSG